MLKNAFIYQSNDLPLTYRFVSLPTILFFVINYFSFTNQENQTQMIEFAQGRVEFLEGYQISESLRVERYQKKAWGVERLRSFDDKNLNENIQKEVYNL